MEAKVKPKVKDVYICEDQKENKGESVLGIVTGHPSLQLTWNPSHSTFGIAALKYSDIERLKKE